MYTRERSCLGSLSTEGGKSYNCHAHFSYGDIPPWNTRWAGVHNNKIRKVSGFVILKWSRLIAWWDSEVGYHSQTFLPTHTVGIQKIAATHTYRSLTMFDSWADFAFPSVRLILRRALRLRLTASLRACSGCTQRKVVGSLSAEGGKSYNCHP